MGEIFILLGIAGAVIAFGRMVAKHAARVGGRTDDAWSKASSRLGLSYTPGSFTRSRQLEGRYRGQRVVVDTVRRGAGASAATYTRYRVEFPQALRMGFSAQRPGLASGISRFLGLQDIRTGDVVFDREVAVRGDDRKRIAAFLTPGRRERIQQLLRHMPELTIDDEGIEYVVSGVHKKPGRIAFTTQQLVSLAQTLTDAEAPSAEATAKAAAKAEAKAAEAEVPADARGAAGGAARAEAKADTRADTKADAKAAAEVGSAAEVQAMAGTEEDVEVKADTRAAARAAARAAVMAATRAEAQAGTGAEVATAAVTAEAETAARTEAKASAAVGAEVATAAVTAEAETAARTEAKAGAAVGAEVPASAAAEPAAEPASGAEPPADEPRPADELPADDEPAAADAPLAGDEPSWRASSAFTDLPDLSWTESGPSAAPDLEWAKPANLSSRPDLSWAEPTAAEARELDWTTPDSEPTEPDLSWGDPPPLAHTTSLPVVFAGGPRLPRDWDVEGEAARAGEADDELSTSMVCETLYGSVEGTLRASEVFEARYEGRQVRWEGPLRRVIDSAYDFAFGIGHHGRAVFQIRAGEPMLLGSGAVRAVVQLSPEAVELLSQRVGERIAFEGRLVSIDVFGRQIYVADGRIPDLAVERASAGESAAEPARATKA